MNRAEFISATAMILFAAFLLGWFACWLILRLTRPGRAEIGALNAMAQELEHAEAARLAAERKLHELEAAFSARLAGSEAELRATMEGLREARAECEELRDYIEQRLARR
ncbi:MAG: hypothetical protein P3W94_003575 [Paracoccus sp. (in: a-proteobacteria)]|nr:hypothetical protein [Paracoccus sp. (in: a-proteobacteria)]